VGSLSCRLKGGESFSGEAFFKKVREKFQQSVGCKSATHKNSILSHFKPREAKAKLEAGKERALHHQEGRWLPA
jgi:hypothetical protein